MFSYSIPSTSAEHRVSSIDTPPTISRANDASRSPVEAASKVATVTAGVGVELDAPLEKVTPAQLNKIVTQLEDSLNDLIDSILMLLLKYTQQMRQQGIELRDIKHTEVLATQAKQLGEMFSAAGIQNWAAAFQIVSAMLTLGFGVRGAISGGKMIKLEHDLKLVPVQNDQVKALTTLLGQKTQRISEMTMTANSVNQSATGTATAIVSGQQQYASARAKKSEMGATSEQYERQKTEDLISYISNFMKEVIELIKELARNKAQMVSAVIG